MPEVVDQLALLFLPLLPLALSLLPTSSGTISPLFSQFLVQTFGNALESSIARRDLGSAGSFGGGNHVAGQPTAKRPIVLVHGLATIAGDYSGLVQHFQDHGGYRQEEIYASSYGDGLLGFTYDSMQCEHVQRFRQLIRAVANFTASQVDVIGYSMGSPIARKAILGGACVDTGEQLGQPLTSSVHTFLGVAGANRDAVYLCDFLNPLIGDAPCNSLNGMACHSRFLDELNYSNNTRYEASSAIYSLYSRSDDVVGYFDCDGLLVCAIPGQDYGLQLLLADHFIAIFTTGQQQLDLLNGLYGTENTTASAPLLFGN